MKVGIVGTAGRAVAWEKHLAGHPSVSEVIITGDLGNIGTVDACLLLNETEQQLQQVLKSIKLGYHTFLISKIPTNSSDIEKLYYASEEANVRLQFSHWPTLAPASQWMAQKVIKPSFIQIVRQITYTTFRESTATHRSLWIDELAYCLKYIHGAVHQININSSKQSTDGGNSATHLMIRFDSGATANIYINSCSNYDQHTRFVSDHSLLLDCNVEEQSVRIGREHENGHLFFEKKELKASEAAEKAVIQFLKAIQLKKPTLYNGYDLLRFSHVLDKIESQMV